MDKIKIERFRVCIAKELDIPPDDVDLFSVINCCERAIRKSCEQNTKELLIGAINEEEEEAVSSEYGREIIERIFTNQIPFIGFYEEKFDEFNKEKDDWRMN